jgi:hypothetical protein
MVADWLASAIDDEAYLSSNQKSFIKTALGTCLLNYANETISQSRIRAGLLTVVR